MGREVHHRRLPILVADLVAYRKLVRQRPRREGQHRKGAGPGGRQSRRRGCCVASWLSSWSSSCCLQGHSRPNRPRTGAAVASGASSNGLVRGRSFAVPAAGVDEVREVVEIHLVPADDVRDPPVVEHHELVGHLPRVAQVVGDDDDADVLAARFVDVAENLCGLLEAQGGGRFVEDQQLVLEVDGAASEIDWRSPPESTATGDSTFGTWIPSPVRASAAISFACCLRMKEMPATFVQTSDSLPRKMFR